MTLDDMLAAAQQALATPEHEQHAAAVAAARKELQRLMQPMDDGHCHLEVGTILSRRTRQGMVELMLNREKTQIRIRLTATCGNLPIGYNQV